MQHGLFFYAGASLFGTKGELQKKGTKRKKTPNVAKKVLPAKLKVEAQSDSDIPDKDSRDDLTCDEDCPGASGVFDDSSHMFGEGGVFEEYGSSENRSMFGVFTKSVQADFNTKSKAYGHMLAQHSDREYCRAFFPSGITSGAKKYGHEERCVLLFSILILCSSDGEFSTRRWDLVKLQSKFWSFHCYCSLRSFFAHLKSRKGT